MADFNTYRESSNTIFSAYSKTHFLSIVYKPFKQYGKRFTFQSGELSKGNSNKFYMNLKEDNFAALLHYTNMLIKNVSLQGFNQFAFSQSNGVYKKISITADKNNSDGDVSKAKFYMNVSEGQNSYGLPLSFFNLIELNKLSQNVLENKYETYIAYLREISTLNLPNNKGKEIYDAIQNMISQSTSKSGNSQNVGNAIQAPANNYSNSYQSNTYQNNQYTNNYQSNNNGATDKQISAIMNLVTRNNNRHPEFEGLTMPQIEDKVRKMSKSQASDIIGYYKDN